MNDYDLSINLLLNWDVRVWRDPGFLERDLGFEQMSRRYAGFGNIVGRWEHNSIND